MAVPKKKLREATLQLLFCSELSGAYEAEIISLIMGELSLSKSAVIECMDRVSRVLKLSAELDAMIASLSNTYEWKRIHKVESCILRLGTYELLHDPQVPPKVAISEALRLARKFSTVEAANFVNALLDGIYKVHQGEALDEEALQCSFQAVEEQQAFWDGEHAATAKQD